MHFDSESEYLVYRLLPVVRSIDSRWARQLEEKYLGGAGLSKTEALGNFVAVSATVAPAQSGGSSMQDSTPARSSAMDESRLLQVERLSGQNPVEARHILDSIGDPLIRATGMVELALANLKGQDSSSIDALQKIASNAEPSDGKLRLIAWLMALYFDVHREKDAEFLLAKAFGLGEQLFADGVKMHPENQAYTFDSFTSLTELANLGAQRSAEPLSVLAHIRSVQNEILQAHMLILFALGYRQRLTS